MKKYTVVGFYQDNNQPWVGWVEADTPLDAVTAAAKEVEWNLSVVEVFEGHLQGVLCEDVCQVINVK